MAADQIDLGKHLLTFDRAHPRRYNQQPFEMLGHSHGSSDLVALDEDLAPGPKSQRAIVTVRETDLLDQ
jgi:hypothetical protein